MSRYLLCPILIFTAVRCRCGSGWVARFKIRPNLFDACGVCEIILASTNRKASLMFDVGSAVCGEVVFQKCGSYSAAVLWVSLLSR